jgi:hypothetical protein
MDLHIYYAVPRFNEAGGHQADGRVERRRIVRWITRCQFISDTMWA